MSSAAIQLPVIQNWSCHNCGGCCREHLIEITEDEKRRIDRQNWTTADGIPAEIPVVQKSGNSTYRLAHNTDGACVFLNEQGLCRIHAKFGEAAKPLACRVYPYAVHPHGNGLTVSLRFSCPSVVQNLGQRVLQQKDDLQKLSREIVGAAKRTVEPPPIHGSQKLDWYDFDQFLQAFDDGLTDDSVNFATQLMRILTWLELVEQSQFSTVRGNKLRDYLRTLTQAAARAQPDSDLPILKPSGIGRVMFRQTVAHLLRHDTEATIRGGLRERMRLLKTGVQFTLGIGNIPQLPDPASVVKVFGSHSGPSDSDDATGLIRKSHQPCFREIEAAFGGRTPEIDRLMVRYFRVKLQGLHFCGLANFQLSLLDGFRSLALMYPAALWVARIRAACHGRKQLELTDVQAALATIDHNYAYSPALGTSSSISRLQLLARSQQITRLCGWYSQ